MAAAEPPGIQRTGPDWALRREFARLLVLAVIVMAGSVVRHYKDRRA